MTIWNVLFSYNGRIGRTTYWAASLGFAFCLGLIFFIAKAVAGPAATLLMLPCVVVFIWVTGAINAKRLHDRNKSGWWQLLGIGGGLLAFAGAALSTKGSALSVPGMMLSLVSLVISIWSLWIAIEMMFMPGTPGGNDHGIREPVTGVSGAGSADQDQPDFAGPQAAFTAQMAAPVRPEAPAAAPVRPAAEARAAPRRAANISQPRGAAPQGFGRRKPA